MTDPPLSNHRGWLLSLLVAVCAFASMAPTLAWPQFTGGNENLVTETALEMRRGGPLLVPEMLGEPRIAKPPLTAWITAAAIRPTILSRLNSADAVAREKAYRDLAWQVRWTGLFAGCALILATHALGSALGGPKLGVSSAVVSASCLLFQKFARQSTTDVHLAFWVVTTNVFFAHAILHRRTWCGIVGGSTAMAIAFLCKGPVALVQTALPVVMFALAFRGSRPAVSESVDVAQAHAEGKSRRRAIFVGGAVFLALALPWFIYVAKTVPGAATRWWVEVKRDGATDLDASSPLQYLLLLPYALPWMTFLIVGLLAAWPARWTAALRGRQPGIRTLFTTTQPIHFATSSLFIPLLVMTLFRDRKDRYMLPFLGPMAVVAGYGLLVFFRSAGRNRRLLSILHWATVLALAGAAIGLGASRALVTTTGEPWFTREMAAWAAVSAVMTVVCGALLSRTRRWPLPACTMGLMLGLQALFMYGYARSSSGRSELKPLADDIVAAFPDANVYDYITSTSRFTRRIDEDVAIYLNRTVRRNAPADIGPSSRPVVLISRQRVGEPEPAPPPGWMSFASRREKNNVWWAYLRVAEKSHPR